jgi:effector-binding domain-containing protein
MIYVRYRTDMRAIASVTGEAFQKLGAFIGSNGIAVAGPPVSVYHDYAADGSMTVDTGFPVAAPALAKAQGEIKAGQTPSGKALRFIHRGPYDGMRATYDRITAYFEQERLPMAPVCWEVYVTDPDRTAPEELVTEIFMQVP